MKPIIVRKAVASEQDLDLIAPLFDSYRQFYDKPPDAGLARAFLRDRLQANESVIFVALAKDAEKALGLVQLYPSFSSVAACRIWVLNDLYVDAAARRHGVGRALMEAARKHAIETGAKRLTLETVVENRTARSLYEALGYRCQDESARYYTLELG